MLDRIVFAFLYNNEARELQAQAFERIVYEDENPTYRNEYLTGAYELRNDTISAPVAISDPDTIKAMTEDLFFDFRGIRLDPSKAVDKVIRINWDFTGVGHRYGIEPENSVLIYAEDKDLPDADLRLSMTRDVPDEVIMGQTSFHPAIRSGNIKV